MACIKASALTFTLLSLLLLDLTQFISHAQLLPVIRDEGTHPEEIKTYLIDVARPNEAGLLSDEELQSWYESFLPNTTLDSGMPRVVYSYRHVMSGFAARLTPHEVSEMKTKEGFLKAQPDKLYHIDTTYTHELLGLSQPFTGEWEGAMYGEGIIIAVIDTGVLPTHPSFSDKMMPPPPTKWKGACSYIGFKCNYKIIGAKAFYGGGNPSPIDDEGHGTHVASTAAGNFVDDASVLEMAKGTAAGMAPKAHLAIYKVCFHNGCWGADTLAAIEQAIIDGVDVISMSISGDPNAKLYEDEISRGSLAAFKKGISACAAAGNAGPGRNTLSHSAPWVLTVGASSTDRRIQVVVKLGNGVELAGETAYQPRLFDSSVFFPIEYPGRYGVNAATYCLPGSLNNINVRGKIVLCMQGGSTNTEKSEAVYAAGGVGMIIMNSVRSGYTTSAEPHVLPAAHVTYMDGQKLKDYVLFSSSTPTASIRFKETTFGARPAPAVASFSSRGPSEMNGDIIKPDVLAPGVNILAAWPFGVGPHPSPWDTKTFNFLSGTSMATPHVSGIVALLKNKYNYWSPAAIQSAIITSAKYLDHDGNGIADEATKNTAEIYATGAGQINPAGAMDPGLVYDLTLDDYSSYLCGLGYSDQEVYMTTGEPVQCARHTVTPPSQLNYPSIAISVNPSSQHLTVSRTVTNVGEANEIYQARIQEPPGVSIYLSHYQLQFSRIHQQKSFSVTLVMKNYHGQGKISWGRLEWVSAKHVVASPIAVRFS